MRHIRTVGLLAVALVGLYSIADAGLARVPRRYNVVDVFAGYAHPVGKYDGIGAISFVDEGRHSYELDADDVYDPGYYLGLSYGQLRGDHFVFNIGFRWTHINQLDTFVYRSPDVLLAWWYTADVNFNQYDIDFAANYLFLNLVEQGWSPYVGLGLHGGMTAQTARGYETETWAELALSANFGAEARLWNHAQGRSFVTLASANSYLLLGSGNRPKYLSLGGALKYYFRM